MPRASISFSLKGNAQLTRKLNRLGDEALPTAAASLYESAQIIMTRSKEVYCPVDTGALRSSGFVNFPEIKDGEIEITMGYGGPAAPYALAVHENPRAGKTQGFSPKGARYKHWAKTGQWKYLETPVKESGQEVRDRLVRRLNAKLTEISGSSGS